MKTTTTTPDLATDSQRVTGPMIVNGIDYGLVMEITKNGCTVCGEAYVKNDTVTVKQDVKTRTGRSWHRRCGSDG